MVPLDRALVSSYRLPIVTMSLTAAVWPQFATQLYISRRYRTFNLLSVYITSGSYVNKQVTFRAQATTCSKLHTRTVMDAGCEYAPWVRSAFPSDSWALVFCCYLVQRWKKALAVRRCDGGWHKLTYLAGWCLVGPGGTYVIDHVSLSSL